VNNNPQFLFVCCQSGAEDALKSEVKRTWPEFRLAFSRPGFVTYKIPADVPTVDRLDLRSTFARTYGKCLGCVKEKTLHERTVALHSLIHVDQVSNIHVWHRETTTSPNKPPSQHDERLADVVCAISDKFAGMRINAIAPPGQLVIDCVVVDRKEWWIGLHRVGSIPSRWPGGIYPEKLPAHAVSRAYLKIKEAIAWSRIPMRRGDPCIEIGCAPGGSCQFLLDHGFHVIGVDPASVHPVVLEHPNFQHVRRRGRDVKRRDLRSVQWLMSDSNVTPRQTLDTVEDIVGHSEVNIRGMLLTLKLSELSQAVKIPEYMTRVGSWGYEHVKARQLTNHRKEICLFALRRRSMLRRPRSKRGR